MRDSQSQGWRFLGKEWRWVLVALYGLTLLFILVLMGKVHLEQVRIGRDEGVLSFMSGESEIKYQDFLATPLNEDEYPLVGEVGLFLLVNGAANVDGRNARNLGEICIAIIYAEHASFPSDSTCPPDKFAAIRTAIQRLENLRYLSPVTYFKDRFQSYGLNVLGEQAISSVRRRWSASGGRAAEKLGRLDLSYPGLLPEMQKARHRYAEAINGEREAANEQK